MGWREQSVYEFGDLDEGEGHFRVEASCGVKQGCLIAPALWVIYSCYVCRCMDAEFGAAWSARHLVLFADDTHVRWDLLSFKQCEEMCHDIDRLFALSSDFRSMPRNQDFWWL